MAGHHWVVVCSGRTATANRGLKLPVAVLLAAGGGGQPQILAIEPEPGRIYLRSTVRPDRSQMRIQWPLQQVAQRLGYDLRRRVIVRRIR